VDGRLVMGWRGALAGLERVTGARSPEGDLAVVYLPSRRTIEIALGQLAGPEVEAAWYDTRDGSWIAAGRHMASGHVDFQSPFPEDAALLLRSSSA
jgi:hypothetical protein